MTISDAEFKPYHTGKPKYVANAREAAFVAWDGEGITPEGEHRQNFVLFGNSAGFRVLANALTTVQCLELILETERHQPSAIHVGFAFGYDTEMILRDLSTRHLKILRARGHVRWQGYRIEYRKSKWLQITRNTKAEKVTCRIWDVWSFFACSFIKAVKEYLGDDIPELIAIEAGKASRGVFTYADLDTHIIPYWETELKLLVRLMDSLRERLYGADLPIRQWHGPGAIATFAMRKNGVGAYMSEVPPEVSEASQYAYAGGRFELFKVGRHKGNVYAYDIRSAYPSAIADLPNLANGQWRYVESPTTIERYGVYHIRFACPELFSAKPMPYFYRDERHAIHYPNIVQGWYWSPEAHVSKYLGNQCEIIDGWVFDHDPSDKPLSWIREVYSTRAQWKRDGNPSQIALKLLMNSMYGKFAQRVGWERFDGPPKWHQLEWAGFITSSTRAMLFRAMAEAYGKNALLGVETDGIFSSEPLSLDVGPDLGQWEVSEYDSMLYLQSGFYFKKTGDEWESKYRGFDKGTISSDDAITALAKWRPWEDDETHSLGALVGTTTRFMSMGTYLRMENAEDWRNMWVTAPRELKLGRDGKRIHRSMFCPECQQRISPADAMHTLTVTKPVGGTSMPHSLPWVGRTDDNPFREFAEDELGVMT
jgi:hypothetical protein